MPNLKQNNRSQVSEVPKFRVDVGLHDLLRRPASRSKPCFPMYSSSYDWGVVGDHKFEVKQLDEMKQECSKHCLSTCNYILAHCYNARRVVVWGVKQALHGFRGAHGPM